MDINGSKFQLGRSFTTQQVPINDKEQTQQRATASVERTPSPTPNPDSLAARALEESHFSQLREIGVEERLGLSDPSKLQVRIQSTLQDGRDLSNKELSQRLSSLYRAEFSEKFRAKDFCSVLLQGFDASQTRLTAGQFEALTELVRTEIAIENLHEKYPELRDEVAI